MERSCDSKMFNYLEGNTPSDVKFSYFGTNLGTVTEFSRYINGYKLAAQILFEKYNETDSRKYEVLDTLVYPLCFIYRQIIELYIKYLYFSYSGTQENDKQQFIKSVSHNLSRAWKQTEPYIRTLLLKMDSSIDLQIVTDYIDEFNEFDNDSFKMRYPINKDLSNVHESSKKLNVLLLNDRIMKLINIFDRMLINNQYDSQKASEILSYYESSKENVMNVLSLLKILADNEPTANYCQYNMLGDNEDVFDLKPSEMRLKLINMIESMDSQSCAVVSLLLFAGAALESEYKIAVVEEERDKDFLKIIEIVLNDYKEYISFDGEIPNEKMVEDLFGKGYKVTYKWLSCSVKLIDNIASKN